VQTGTHVQTVLQEQVLPTQEQLLTQEQGPEPITQSQVQTAPGGFGVPHGTV